MSQTENLPLLPFEVIESIEDFKVGDRHDRNNDCYFPVTYQERRCNIQTPTLYVMFGLSSHKNPGESIQKYSLHFSLKPIDQEVATFHKMLDCMDQFAAEYKLFDDAEYCSSVRLVEDKTKKSDLFRCKIPTTANGNKLIIDIIDANKKVWALPTIAEFKKLVKHHTKVKCIIEVNPIWYAGKKFGLTYRIMKMQLCPNHNNRSYKLKFR